MEPIGQRKGNNAKPLENVTIPQFKQHEGSTVNVTTVQPFLEICCIPIRNHWYSVHFQWPALAWNRARPRRLGGQLRGNTVIGKPSKTLGYSNIPCFLKVWCSAASFSGGIGMNQLRNLPSGARTIPCENYWKTMCFLGIPVLTSTAGGRSEAAK